METGRDATARTPPVPVGGVGVRFSGQGNDYFRIWIADLLCMMLTGGLYWPWLRRRRWLFLDANTWVGAHRLADLQQTPLPGVWPPRWQLLAVGAFIIGLWLFITRSMGIFGWPMLVALFGISGPLWLYTGWRARLGLVGWRGAPLDFQGDLLTACLVWIRMCLPLVPAGLLISALFLDNFRLWLLGRSWTSRYGLTSEVQELIPWMVALSVALAMANWYHAAVHFGLGHVHHPDGVGRSRLHFWPLLRAALVAMVLILPAPFLAIGLVYANWPVLLSLLSIEPPGTLENLSNLAPDADSLFGSLRLDVSVLDGSVLTDGGLCVACRATMVLLMLAGCGLLLMMGWRYFSTRLWNKTWSTFRVGGYAFEGHLAAGRLMATGFFCDVLTLLTLGLYYPYGVVRMARLRRESVRVLSLTEPIEGAVNPPPATPLAVPRPRTHWVLALGLMAAPLVFAVWVALYGRPVLSDMLVRAMPPAFDTALSDATLTRLQREGVQASGLSIETQQRLREGLQAAVQKSWDARELPPYRIQFVKGGDVLGPNAVALPGNLILITDELLGLAARQPDRAAVLVGVLGHEMAHVIHQDPQRILLLASLRKSVKMVLTGQGQDDLLASGADTVLYQGYGADIRQAADAGSIRMLRANGHSPQVMADFLKALEAARFANPAWMVAAQRVPISLSAQPVDARRLEAFKDKSE